MKHDWTKRAMIGAAATFALVLSGCTADAGSTPTELSTEEAVAGLGGQEQYDKLMALYQEAVDAGQTTVTIYGPEAEAQTAAISDTWAAYFPEITLVGVQINGPSLAERIAAEATTGQGSADVVISGSSDIVTNSDHLREFESFTGTEIDDEYRGPKGTIASAMMPFAFVYNPNGVAADEVPTEWSQLLEPEWSGRLSIPDPTNPNAMFNSINSLLYHGVWTEADLERLAANDPTLVPGATINGPLTNTAQGQSDGAFMVSTTTAQKAIADGAPIEIAFPMASDNILIPEYLGLLGSSPSPLAGELYGNWRLTPAAADAVAEYGFYSFVEGSAAPEGFPPLSEVDILPQVPFDDLMESYGKTMPLLREIFAS